MRNGPGVVLLVFAVGALAGCSSGSKPSDPPPAPAPGPGPGADLGPNPGLTYTPSPVSVSVTFDGEYAATRTVSFATGGSIRATGRDGTVYDLHVPPGALLAEETITVTPITTIAGLPFSGGVLAGVQLAPEGLSFMAPPTLTITPASPLPADAIGVGHRGAGDALFLTSVARSGGALAFALGHFSGRAVVTGTAAERTTQAGRQPASAEDAAEQRLTNLIEGGRASGQFPTPEQLDAILRDWFNGSVRPGLEAALTDDARLMCAAGEYYRWNTLTELLGVGERFVRERDWGREAVRRGLVHAFDEASRRCVTDRDPRQVSVMLSLGRQAKLLGFDGTVADVAAGVAKAKKCARFKVAFESKIDWFTPNSGGAVVHYTWSSAEALVRSDDPAGQLIFLPAEATATDAVVYQASGSSYGFSYPAAFNVSYFTTRLDRALQCGGNPPAPPFEVVLHYETHVSAVESTGWYGLFVQAHTPIEIGAVFEAKDFVQGTGGVFARKVYSSAGPSNTGGTYSEQTTITVTHDPIP